MADDEVTRRRKAREAAEKAKKKAIDAVNAKKAKQAKEVYKAWVQGQKAKKKADRIREQNRNKDK